MVSIVLVLLLVQTVGIVQDALLNLVFGDNQQSVNSPRSHDLMIWNWTQTVQPALWTAGPLCRATYQCFHIPTQGSLISIEKMMTFSGFQRIKSLCHHCQPEGTSPRELQAWFCTSFFFELASLQDQHPGKWLYWTKFKTFVIKRRPRPSPPLMAHISISRA